MRQFNQLSVSTRSVLQSNQAATVCLRPSYRPVTVSLFYWPHRRTAVWITRPSNRAVVPRLSPPSAAAWSLARLLLPGRCSMLFRWPSVRSCARLAVAALVAVRRPLRRSPALSASPVDRPFFGTRSLLRFPPRCSCDRLSIVSTVSRRHQRWPPKHVLFYENGGCQFSGPYPYEVCSLGPSTKCHGRN